MVKLIDTLLYNKDTGSWHDYNYRTNTQNLKFYGSSAFPIFTGCIDESDEDKPEQFFNYMQVI